MSHIWLFENEQLGQVRIIMQGTDPWFVAKDIAICLGYVNTQDAITEYCKKFTCLGEQFFEGAKPIYTPENIKFSTTYFPLDPQTIIIPESDLYRLIMHSKLSAVDAFLDYVVEEVLPYVRKAEKPDVFIDPNGAYYNGSLIGQFKWTM